MQHKLSFKRILIFGLILTNLLFCLNFQVFATDTEDYISQLSNLISKYDDDNYFQSISITLGDNKIIIDGESLPLDQNGTIAFIENGKMMIPINEFIKILNASMYLDNHNNTAVISTEDKNVQIPVDNNTLYNKLNSADKVLPIREIAEALDCEVSWNNSTKTVVLTRQFQTKRLIVFNQNFNPYPAIEVIKGNGFSILQFEKIDDVKWFIDNNSTLKIEPDYIHNEPGYSQTKVFRPKNVDFLSWGAAAIGTEDFFNQTKENAKEVIVAVVDTGLDADHEFFRNKIIQGYDVYHSDNQCEDSLGHGSHVASTVLDITRANPQIKVMPVKVFGYANSTPSTVIAAGIDYAVEHGADVINLSLGGQFKSELEQQAINRAAAKNIAVIAAAGNDGLDISNMDYSPATLDNVITVAATNNNNQLAYFSNYGKGVIDFTAPGVDILGVMSGYNGYYIQMSGTSMATPHVAGVYALFISTNKGVAVQNVTDILKEVAQSNNDSTHYGAGIIRLTGLELTQLLFELKVTGENIHIDYSKLIVFN